MIIVTGLRRSGTSAMMTALKEAGVEIIGKKMEDEHNPTGHWETGAAASGLKYDFGSGVIKVLAEGLVVSDKKLIGKTIVMMRNPRNVIGSFIGIGRYDDNIGLKLAYQTHRMFEVLKGREYIITEYENLIKNPRKEMKRVCGFIGRGDYKKGAKAINISLNKSPKCGSAVMGLKRYEQIYEQKRKKAS